MRKHLLKDFTTLYHVDLHGNVRRNPKLSGTTHNVFGIRVGVGITVAVRKRGTSTIRNSLFSRAGELAKGRKARLAGPATSSRQCQMGETCRFEWGSWECNSADEFELLLPIATKEAKQKKSPFDKTILRKFSRGLETCRDEWTYAFEKVSLEQKVKRWLKPTTRRLTAGVGQTSHLKN